MGKRSGAALPRVSDFSTFNGPGTRFWPTQHRVRPEYLPEPYVYTDNVVVGMRYKSPVTRGSVDPATGFRCSTSYSRIIFKCDNPTDSFQWNYVIGGRWPYTVFEECDCPIQGVGFTLTDGGYFSTSVGSVGVNPDYVNRAIAEAYDDLRQAKLSLGVALAELGKTLGFLASTVERLIRVLIVIQRVIRGKSNPWKTWTSLGLKGRPPKSRVKSQASGSWLEYQYAVLPLINDVYGALELAKSGLRERNLLFSVQRTIGGSVDPSSFVFTSHSPSEVNGSVKQSARVRFTGVVNPGYLSAAAELGLTNPLLIGWELVPFSFVVDWIMPIGMVLSSFDAPLGVRFVDGNLTKVVYGKVQAKRLTPVFGSIQGNLPEAKLSILAMQRSTYLSWPIALPYMKAPWSNTRAASALALLAQLSK